MKKIFDIENNDFCYYTIRVLLILFYPIWLIIGLFESKSWKEYKEGIKIPFEKWGDYKTKQKELR